MMRKRLAGFAAALCASAALYTATPAAAEEIRLAVGCPAIPICADWVWAEDVAKQLNEAGLEAKVYVGGALGKDPEIVDQLSQGLLQFGLTNFVMIHQVDPRVLGFMAPYMFDDMEHMFRAIDETDLLDPIKESMEAQGIKIAALTGTGGTVGIFNNKKAVEGANQRNREWTYKAAAAELDQLGKLGVTVTKLSPEARADFVERSKKAWPVLMPADSVDDFVAAAEKTRK